MCYKNKLTRFQDNRSQKNPSHDELLEMWKRNQRSSQRKPTFSEQKLRQ
jgi:hypothetical protein